MLYLLIVRGRAVSLTFELEASDSVAHKSIPLE